MGYHVTPLTGADLTPERLRAFDAVVIGVRAFNVRTDLAAGLPALFAYAENGGTVVEQYNTPNELRNPRLAPYDLTLDGNLPAHRVTNENAPVTLLVRRIIPRSTCPTKSPPPTSRVGCRSAASISRANGTRRTGRNSSRAAIPAKLR